MVVVKRHGHKEKFDDRKIYASCYAACINCEIEKKYAEDVCEKIAKEIKKWANKQKSVDSNSIFRKVIEKLKEIGEEDVAFMYETHRDIS